MAVKAPADVYKRQAQKRDDVSPRLHIRDEQRQDDANGKANENALDEADLVVPVSYTHLDVYKRQAMGHVAQKPHLRVAHRKREVTLQPLLQVGEKMCIRDRRSPRGDCSMT